jgi:HAE1 family hydrophobic/amphiphilic exporter-1
VEPVEAFVRNPVKVAVGVLLVALFGIVSLVRMPMQLTPEVQVPTITIETTWPGASPQEVEREIVQKQEEQLKSVEGLTKLSSESSDSRASVIMEFVVGTNMDSALLKVNARLQQVREYPEDANEPVISTSSSDGSPIAWFILGPLVPEREEVEQFAKENPETAAALAPVIAAQSIGLRLARLRVAAENEPRVAPLLPPPQDIPKLRRLAEDLIEARFERVPGVSNSNTLGGRTDEMRVIVDPARLAARGLTITDVRSALRGRNKDTSGGDFWEGKRRYVVRTLGQFDSVDSVADLILTEQGGVPVYVKDVADVELGFKKPDGIVQNFGETSIAVNCLRETGANVLDVMEGLREATAELNDSALQKRGLLLKQVYDETDYIYSAIGLVNQNIVIGGILTFIVLLLFLRSLRSTLVISLAIPTSLIGSFLVLGMLGRSLNVISLAGLAFAVGMLVDNAVVVLENIYRHYQEGDPPVRAAVKGTQEVWGAVVASTLTTLAVFIPVVFVEEEAGQLFRDIALAISSAVALSLIVSVTVISTATSRILKERNVEEQAQRRVGLGAIDRFGSAARRAVVGANAWIQRSRLRELAVVVALVGTSLLGSWMLMPKLEYLPTGNRNLVFGILLPPPGYNLDQLVELGQQIEDDLRPYWDVDRDDPALEDLDAPAISDFFYVARGRQVFLGLRAIDPLRAAELVPLIQRTSMRLPGTFGVAKQSSLFEQGLSAGRTVDVEITGPDLPVLTQIGFRVMVAVGGAIEGAQAFPRPSLDLSNPEVHVRPHWEKAEQLGFSARDLGYTISALVDGAYATDYYVGGEEIDLTIMGRQDYVGRSQDLAELPVATPTGDLVPLSAMANIEMSSGPEQINHRERVRTITIQVSPPPEVALEDAMDTIQTQIIDPLRAEGSLPDMVQINLAGTADKLRATGAALFWNLVLALLITYLLMAALFESWIYPLVIILSVPLGAVGGFAGLRLLNVFTLQALDVLTMLGFVILIGTVVNNPILIVHQSLQHMKHDGMTAPQAIQESVGSRMRPIFMTTLTTVFGLMPLVVSPGAGSELYRGLGSVVLGGLIVSTVFTLFLVPTMFHLMLGLRRKPVEAKSPAE